MTVLIVKYSFMFLAFERFLTAVHELKALPQKDVEKKVEEIWEQFLAPNAPIPVNIDSKSMNITKKNIQNPDRWTFDAAAVSFHFD